MKYKIAARKYMRSAVLAGAITALCAPVMAQDQDVEGAEIEEIIPAIAQIGYHGIELAVTSRFSTDVYELDARFAAGFAEYGRNHIVYGCRLTHTAIQDPRLPEEWQHPWQRWTHRHNAAIDIRAHSNVLVANAMLRNGIRVYINPGMSHLKAAIYDGWACLGSANLDNLSLRTNREMNLATSHPPAVDELFRRVFAPDMETSAELTEPLPSNWADYLAELKEKGYTRKEPAA